MSLKCILQGQDSKNLVTKVELNEHIADKNNPHEVTAEQVGAMHDYGLITPENLQTWVSKQKFSGTFLLTPSTTQGVPKTRYWFGEFIIISKDIFNDFAIYLFTDAEFYCCVTSSGQWSNSWLQIHPNKYHTNPNLLDNWYFINPVNQRGQTEYTEAGKCSIDRWWLQYDTSLSIVDGGVKISGKWDIEQFFENPLPNATYTLSMLYKDKIGTDDLRFIVGNRSDGDIKGVNTKNASGLLSFTVTSDSINKLIIGFAGSLDNSVTVLAVKLELGDTQTLAHKEGDTWVLNEIPDYGEQLRRCQRYFVRYKFTQYQTIGLGYEGPIYSFVQLALPVPMRLDKPTCSLSAPVHIGNNDRATLMSGATQNTLILGVNYSTLSNPAGATYAYSTDANGVEISISADL